MSRFDSKNVFYNPSFESEKDPDEFKEEIKVSICSQPVKEPATWLLGARARWCGRPAVVASVAVVLLLVLGITLTLLLQHMNREHTKGGSALDPWSGDTSLQGLSTSPTRHVPHGSLRPQAELETITYPKCGGILTDLEGTISSPNHPGPYPPNSTCVWMIRVSPPSLVQLHISSLAVEGPAPCLFDWLEVREESEQTTRVFRFCGSVAPPTVNTHSSTVRVSFHSDGSIEASGFTAQYHTIFPWQKSCSREEFMCDGGLCLLPMLVCDSWPDCQDRSDEADCSHIHTECGGQKTGVSGSLSSPNHPGSYPHQQRCTWHISAEEGHAISLSFHNFSLETQDVCEFDFVEVWDGGLSGDGHVLGRYCGSGLPPDLTSSGPTMTVVFVADEGVADTGFYASYQVISISERACWPERLACSSGECLRPEWLCDGWDDCADGADEQNCANSTSPSFMSSCEPIQVEMCQGLNYNLTSFPNIWLSIVDQSQASDMLHKYKVLMELPCFEPLRRLLCAVFLPHCSLQGGVLEPCRSVCAAAQKRCGRTLDILGLSWPYSCHLLPDAQGPLACSRP